MTNGRQGRVVQFLEQLFLQGSMKRFVVVVLLLVVVLLVVVVGGMMQGLDIHDAHLFAIGKLQQVHPQERCGRR